MNQNKIVLSITLLMGALLTAFMFSWYQQQNNVDISVKNNELERQYSVSFGPETAKVTIVEFLTLLVRLAEHFTLLLRKS